MGEEVDSDSVEDGVEVDGEEVADGSGHAAEETTADAKVERDAEIGFEAEADVDGGEAHRAQSRVQGEGHIELNEGDVVLEGDGVKVGIDDHLGHSADNDLQEKSV